MRTQRTGAAGRGTTGSSRAALLCGALATLAIYACGHQLDGTLFEEAPVEDHGPIGESGELGKADGFVWQCPAGRTCKPGLLDRLFRDQPTGRLACQAYDNRRNPYWAVDGQCKCFGCTGPSSPPRTCTPETRYSLLSRRCGTDQCNRKDIAADCTVRNTKISCCEEENSATSCAQQYTCGPTSSATPPPTPTPPVGNCNGYPIGTVACITPGYYTAQCTCTTAGNQPVCRWGAIKNCCDDINC
ncbi:MAG: hypothetical protein KKI08_04085 [Armatimonadetes bacterium]|nr:hypothetical protein [Armatimonadota bacterium]